MNECFSGDRAIGELREEFKANNLRGWIWEWLIDVLAPYIQIRIARRYKAEVYSPSGSWDDEGIRDLLNQFIVERCVNGTALLTPLRIADSTGGVIRTLQRSVHNFVISERVRTISDNIYRRMLDVLANDQELRPLAGVGTRSAYGLVLWQDDPPPVLSSADFARALLTFPENLRIVRYSQGDRQSPMLLKNDLSAIAHAVIRSTNRLCTAAQLVRLIEMRFDISGPPEVSSIDAARNVHSELADPLEMAAAADLAAKFVALLSERQRAILSALMSADPPPSVRDVAEKAGYSKSVVHREQQAIGELILSLNVTDPKEQSQFFTAVSSFLEMSA